MSQTPSDCLVLLNPESGTVRNDEDLLDRIRSHPALEGVDVHLTADPMELARVARVAREQGRRMVVAGGGDGTVHAVANGLLHGDRRGAEDLPALAVLPIGTANDFARTLGVHEIEVALDAIGSVRRELAAVAGRSAPAGQAEIVGVDLIEVTIDDGEPEVVTNDWVVGFGGRVQHEVTPEVKQRWGPFAYMRTGVAALGEGMFRALVEVDGGPSRDLEFLNIAVSNGRYSGGGIPIAPEARVDDGALDVIVIRPVDVAAIASLAPLIALGHHLGHDSVTASAAGHLRVTATDGTLDFSMDGEPSSGTSAEVRVLQGALRMILGPDAHTI